MAMTTRTRGRSRWRRSLRERGSIGSARAGHHSTIRAHTHARARAAHITRVHAPRTRVGRDSLAHGQWPSAVHARRHEQAAPQPLRRAPRSCHRPHSAHRFSSFLGALLPGPAPSWRPAAAYRYMHSGRPPPVGAGPSAVRRRRPTTLAAYSTRSYYIYIRCIVFIMHVRAVRRRRRRH